MMFRVVPGRIDEGGRRRADFDRVFDHVLSHVSDRALGVMYVYIDEKHIR